MTDFVGADINTDDSTRHASGSVPDAGSGISSHPASSEDGELAKPLGAGAEFARHTGGPESIAGFGAGPGQTHGTEGEPGRETQPMTARSGGEHERKNVPEPAAPSKPVADFGAVAAVVRIPQFRRLWLVLGLSSLGDWLGLLATSLFAADQVQGSTAKGAAFGAVIAMRLLPAMLLGPLAGVFADRMDRRWTMAICDVLRFVLFASIPLAAVFLDRPAAAVTWALIATFLIEMVAMFWIPAKEAGLPNLVPKSRLEAANQLTLLTTYGIAPVLAAGLIALLSRALLSAVDEDASRLWITPIDLALYINACTFLIAAVVVFFFIKRISDRAQDVGARHVEQPSVARAMVQGWHFVRGTVMVRGLVYGIVGAFAAGGAVIGVSKFYAASLSGGDAAFGLLFGTLFVGLGAGLGLGPTLVRALSRRRWFGMSIVLSGVAVALLAVAPHLAVAIPLVFLVGAGAGMAYLSGTTLLGREVSDAMRGRVFAFVQSAVRVVLMLAITVASVLGGVGGSRVLELGPLDASVSTTRILLGLAGFLAVATGVLAFHRMDDKPGVPVIGDLIASLRGRPLAIPGAPASGLLVAFEGGEGAGKSTQLVKLAAWLKAGGYPVVDTHEPGATQLGKSIRTLLLHTDPSAAPSPQAEALLYAADRADHVATVIRPALDAGKIVLTDRYVDSSLAYQAGGRQLPSAEVAWLSEWATGALKPDLVVLLDLDPAVGLARAARRSKADRLERESLEFHRRIRRVYRDLAAADPDRYLVLDATADPDEIAGQVQERINALLPNPAAVRFTDGSILANTH